MYVHAYAHNYKTYAVSGRREPHCPSGRLGSLGIRLVSGFEPSLGNFGSCQGALALLPLKRCSFSYGRAIQIC